MWKRADEHQRESRLHGAEGRWAVSNRRRRTGARGARIAVNFAPMIDVTFLLLIFFLVTTTFERAEGILASEFPRDAGAPSVALPLSPIVIRLHQTGSAHEDVEITIDRFESTAADFEELAALIGRIHEEPGFDKDTPVVIVTDDDVRWDHVVACWNAALRAQCTRIAFAEP